mgnify:CR=1 FL=1
MSDAYSDRGNKDLSVGNAKGQGSIMPKASGKSHASPGGPFLIGDTMTGGYGKGPDILHGCTIAVDKGEIAVIVGPNGAGKSTAMKAVFGMLDVRSGKTSPALALRPAWPRGWALCLKPRISSRQ